MITLKCHKETGEDICDPEGGKRVSLPTIQGFGMFGMAQPRVPSGQIKPTPPNKVIFRVIDRSF